MNDDAFLNNLEGPISRNVNLRRNVHNIKINENNSKTYTLKHSKDIEGYLIRKYSKPKYEKCVEKVVANGIYSQDPSITMLLFYHVRICRILETREFINIALLVYVNFI